MVEKKKLQFKSQKARKQIARTIRKTQVYITEQEKHLKEKLVNVRRMNHDLMRHQKERDIIAPKRDEAHRAWIMAQEQRNEMRIHYERIKMERDEENRYLNAVRNDHRERAFYQGKKIVMMSTKAVDDFDMRGKEEHVIKEERKLLELTDELQSKQNARRHAINELEHTKTQRAA